MRPASLVISWLVLGTLIFVQEANIVAAEPVITRGVGPDFVELDAALIKLRKQLGATAATVAVSLDGKLLYSRGYGWSDQDEKRPAPPDALMRIASCSKPLTAAAIRRLIDVGKLRGDTRVAEYLGLKPSGETADARWAKITVDHLLDHRGGWDRGTTFDPMTNPGRIARELKLSREPTIGDIVRFMLTQPLQFEPGERAAYSNFGYCLLGRMIERATGVQYYTALDRLVLRPFEIADIRLAHSKRTDRDRREVEYPKSGESVHIDVMDAHGGLVASAPALCQYMDRYWISGHPRKTSERESWLFFGSLPGTTAMMLQRRDGFNVAVLINGRRDASFGADNEAMSKAVEAALDEATRKKPAKN